MISAILIDDEENNRDVLRTLLEKNYAEVEIVDEASSAEEAYVKINTHKPQLIFLDIKMPQENGFDLLKRFSVIDFEVIFVTAHDRYAIRAFDFNAIGYILKPINPQKLINTLEKAVKKIKTNVPDETMLHFVNTISDKNDLIHKFSVHSGGKVVFINVADVSFIETKEDNTTLTLFDNSHFHSSKDLVKYEAVLEGVGNFVRINKNVIINTSAIQSYSKGELCIIELQTGQSFEVSRRRKSEIIRQLKAL